MSHGRCPDCSETVSRKSWSMPGQRKVYWVAAYKNQGELIDWDVPTTEMNSTDVYFYERKYPKNVSKLLDIYCANCFVVRITE